MRQRWPSRLFFIFAGIASAAGLGNLWRFPYLTYKYGGGAFLIPYILAIILLGIPLLIMEFSLGEMMQKAAPRAFEKIKKGLGVVGWMAVLVSLVIVSYYVVIIGWGIIYLFKSFTLAWGDNPAQHFSNFLKDSGSVNVLGGINWVIALGLLLAWLIIFFRLWKGMRSLSNSLKYFIPIPIILLIIMLIRGVSLPGSLEGILYFLKPDFSALMDGEVWIAAFSQMLFSLSLAGGTMITFASYESKKADITENATIISLSDFLISILSGLVVFSTIGFMAYQANLPVGNVVTTGPSLAFIVFPQALNIMPLSTLFTIFFFVILVSLGTNAASSIIEGSVASIKDVKPRWRRMDIVFWLCFGFFLLGLIYTTGAGIYLIDIVDHYISEFGLVLVIILETIIVGWMLGGEKIRYYINKVSDFRMGLWWDYAVMYIAPIVFLFLLLMQVYKEISIPYGGYPLWARMVGIISVLLVIILSFIFNKLSEKKDML